MTRTNNNRSRSRQAGFIVTAELILLSTILVIGLVVGMATVRDAINQELEDLSVALGGLNQSLEIQSVTDPATGNLTAGAAFTDTVDQPTDPDSIVNDTGVSEF